MNYYYYYCCRSTIIILSLLVVVLFLTLTPWPESASELYRPSDRRLSAKLVPTFADRECHEVCVPDPYGRILGLLLLLLLLLLLFSFIPCALHEVQLE
jgi:hypothetical protein